MSKKITGFYPDIKPHISPSAFQAWHRQRSSFIKSYFKGEKIPENSAMRAGTKIHALIEGGFLPADNRFENNESEMVVQLSNGVEMLGIPDSYGKHDGTINFVDYKTGKENKWSAEMLASDLKMLATAWLVWHVTGRLDEGVVGILEWIGTEWNGEELVPIDEPHASYSYHYTKEALEKAEKSILKTTKEVNEEYKNFGKSTEEHIDRADTEDYAKLEEQKKEIEIKQDAIKERILDQMVMGSVKSFKTELGTFSVTVRKSYKYPDKLEAEHDGKKYTLEGVTKISAAMSAAKKNYELENEPDSTSKSIGFRAKAVKKK